MLYPHNGNRAELPGQLEKSFTHGLRAGSQDDEAGCLEFHEAL